MPASAVRIRRTRRSDLDSIIVIETICFPDPWDSSVFAEALDQYPSTFFAAEDGGKLVGFIAAGIEDTGEEIYGHIMNLAVSPEYRNRGIGTLLVKRVEQEVMAAGASGIQLEVRIGNCAAQQFYLTCGYRPVFHIAAYYANSEDAIIMMKWFRF
jgi:ribosomal-protein-alanine N-acetyltransferase